MDFIKIMMENYVSFEVAKLLREKGFSGLCTAYYDCFTTNNFHCGYEPTDFNSIDTKIRDIVAAPTFKMVMKWLRELHNLSVEVFRTAHGYVGRIGDITSDTYIKYLTEDGDGPLSGQYTSWEKACNASIKYVLKNLI